MYSTQPPQETSSASGVQKFEDILQGCHIKVDQISSILRDLQQRLYNPHPQPALAKQADNPVKMSIEGSLTVLGNRLLELENLAATLLHG